MHQKRLYNVNITETFTNHSYLRYIRTLSCLQKQFVETPIKEPRIKVCKTLLWRYQTVFKRRISVRIHQGRKRLKVVQKGLKRRLIFYGRKRGLKKELKFR